MSECNNEMNFIKCHLCPLSEEHKPHYSLDGYLNGTYKLLCLATGRYLEITKCIKEA